MLHTVHGWLVATTTAAALALAASACEGCRDAPVDPGREASDGQTRAEQASEYEGVATDSTQPEADDTLGELLPDTPGLPRLPGVDALELGTTRLDAMPAHLRGPQPSALTPDAPVAGWVSARVARRPDRADRVHLVRLDLPADLDVRAWLTARWGAPTLAADDSGLTFPGGRLQAAYWFAPDAGVQVKHLERDDRQRLVFRAYRPLAAVIGTGEVFGVEPPGGLLGKTSRQAREHYGADELTRVDAGADLVQRTWPGIEAASEPVRIRWPAHDDDDAPIARFWLEIGHATAPGPFDADAVLAAVEQTWGKVVPGDGAHHHHAGTIETAAGRHIEVYRVPAAGIVRLEIR